MGVLCGALACVGLPRSWHAIVANWAVIGVSGWVVLRATRPECPRFLTWRPLVALGTIWYGVYVWHALIPPAIRRVEGAADIWVRFPEEGWIRFAIVLPLAVAIARWSWRWIEAPCNRWKDRFPYGRPQTQLDPRVVYRPES